jgi:hypothetical protein
MKMKLPLTFTTTDIERYPNFQTAEEYFSYMDKQEQAYKDLLKELLEQGVSTT